MDVLMKTPEFDRFSAAAMPGKNELLCSCTRIQDIVLNSKGELKLVPEFRAANRVEINEKCIPKVPDVKVRVRNIICLERVLFREIVFFWLGQLNIRFAGN